MDTQYAKAYKRAAAYVAKVSGVDPRFHCTNVHIVMNTSETVLFFGDAFAVTTRLANGMRWFIVLFQNGGFELFAADTIYSISVLARLDIAEVPDILTEPKERGKTYAAATYKSRKAK